jgi:predicted ArsR family transcriptional regulator
MRFVEVRMEAMGWVKSESRRRILELLKLQGPMTADQLAEELEITAMGVRGHLAILERDGLIEYRAEQRGMGRPGYVYSLTDVGDELFPRTYAQMSNSLLDAVRDLQGEEGIDQLFEKRTQLLEGQYGARMAERSLVDRVKELAHIRTEEGYMADWEKLDADTFLLREHNCAICQIARRCVQACRYELALFQRVLPGAEVTRREHMIKGDMTCTYVIRRKSRVRGQPRRAGSAC